MNWIKKRKNAGFTLVELLITILIIGIVIGIGTFFVINIINNSKETTQEIAYENIKTSARLYVEENNDNVIWKKQNNSDTKTETTCIPLEYLINKGYLKESDIQNINKTSVIITKDIISKSILKEELSGKQCDNGNVAVIPTSKYCLDVTYNGKEQSLINPSKATNGYTFEEKKETDVGNHTIEATLMTGYIWEDNTDGVKTITCSINKADIELSLSEDGTEPTIGTTKTTLKTNIPGTISIKSSNEKYVTATVTDNNIDKEKDITINVLATRNTNTIITITVTPNDEYKNNYKATSIEYIVGKSTRKKVAIPTCNNLTYTGAEQELISTNESYTLQNNKQTNVGKYEVTAKLKYGYEWEDGSLTPKTFTCSINKSNDFYIITLDNQNADIKTGTKQIYEKFNTGIYLDNESQKLMTPNQNPIEIPEKKGYEFAGYYTETKGNGNQMISDINNIGNITEKFTSSYFNSNDTIYAHWSPIQYYIKYSSNGGKIKENTTIENTICTYDEECQLNDNPFEKDGYEFLYWSTNPNGGENIYENKEIVKNLSFENSTSITLYAQWTENTYTINLDKNGGTGGTDKIYELYDYGIYLDYDCQEIMTPNNNNKLSIPQKPGYKFQGYYNTPTKDNSSKLLIDANGQITNNFDDKEYNSDATIFAHWEPIQYTITYHSNNEDNSTKNTICEYGKECIIETNSFENPGYTFIKWNKETDGSGNSYEPQTVIDLTKESNNTINLYAQWEAGTYTITLDKQGGSNGKSKIYEKYNDRIYKGYYYELMTSTEYNVEIPNRNGYLFQGYYNDTTGTTKMIDENGYITSDFSPTTFTTDGSLYAKWSPNTYTITLDKEGGTGGKNEIYELYDTRIYYLTTSANPQKITMTTTTNNINVPTKNGYTFQGYYTKKNGKGTKYIDSKGYITSNFRPTRYIYDNTLYAYWIDTSKPTCGNISYKENNNTYYYEPNTWTKNNRTITVQCNDSSNSCTEPSVSKTYSETIDTDSLTISDTSNNTSSCGFNVLIDKIKPNATYSFTNEEEWINYDREIKITLTDKDSGLQSYAITNSSTEPTTWTNIENAPESKIIIKSISTNGTYYIWVKDVAGNINNGVKFETKIDKEKPVINVKAYKSGTNELKKSATTKNTNELKISTWVNYAYDFDFTGTTDSSSGIKSYVWQWNNSGNSTLKRNLPTNNTNNEVDYYKTLSANGARYAKLTVTDKANNSTYMDIIVYIDTEPPYINTNVSSPKTNIKIKHTWSSDGTVRYITPNDNSCDKRTQVCNLDATFQYKAGTIELIYTTTDGSLYKDDISGFSYMELQAISQTDKYGNNMTIGSTCRKYYDNPCTNIYNTIIYDKAGNSAYGYQIKFITRY